MRQIFFLWVLITFLSPSVWAQTTSAFLKEIREHLFYSDFDQKKSVALYDRIVQHPSKSPVILAYKGAAEALLAQYGWNPVTRMNHLKQAAESMNTAVSRDTKNLEVRFLRFYFENSVPAYLGFGKHLEEDKKILLGNIHQFTKENFGKDMCDYIMSYMLEHGKFSSKEAEQIRTTQLSLGE
jgi:hypothetical protein